MLNAFLDALIVVGEITGGILLADKIKTKLCKLKENKTPPTSESTTLPAK